MSAVAEHKIANWIFNPFVYIAGAQALGLGTAAILVAGVIGLQSWTHFDGVLDAHVGLLVSPWFILAEGFLDWLYLALVLTLFGLLFSRSSFRLVDVLGTQALARWPTIFIALLTLPPAFSRFSATLVKTMLTDHTLVPFTSVDGVYFLVASLLMLPLSVWMIALMYNAYAVSCNVRGWRAGFSFAAGLILAEILSKIMIGAMHPA